jgi:hypothetical protein
VSGFEPKLAECERRQQYYNIRQYMSYKIDKCWGRLQLTPAALQTSCPDISTQVDISQMMLISRDLRLAKKV